LTTFRPCAHQRAEIEFDVADLDAGRPAWPLSWAHSSLESSKRLAGMQRRSDSAARVGRFSIQGHGLQLPARIAARRGRRR